MRQGGRVGPGRRLVDVAPSLAVWSYVGAVLVVLLLMWPLGDRFWLSTLLLVGPRWVMGVPLLAFGHTKHTRRIGTRIDHVLLGDGWRCVSARVGEVIGLDHSPLVVDLVRDGPGS